MSKGFGAIGLFIVIAAIGISGAAVYLSKNYDLSLNISRKSLLPSDSPVVSDTESLPTTNLQDLSCGILGFESDDYSYYTAFGSTRYKKYGKEFKEKISVENTGKINQALLSVMADIPPKYNPEMMWCLTATNKILLVAKPDAELFFFDNQYNLIKNLHIKNFTQIFDPLAFTKDNVLYLQQSSKDYKTGRMTDAVLKVNLNDGSQKALNYSERVETVGVPQKNNQDQTSTMTSKNLEITFTAPAGVEATYNPLYDQAIEFFYFRKGEDELQISLGKNPYCTPSTPGYFRDIQIINFANKWQINKVRGDDPRDSQTKWGGQVLAEDGICIGFKETINTDPEMEKVFDQILTTAKVN
jgi:hypothetical protein